MNIVKWSNAEKILFRIFFSYYFFYLFPFPLDHLPFGIGDGISDLVGGFWNWFNHLVKVYLFKINLDFPPGMGSGDTMYQYIAVTSRIILTIITSIIWTFIDWKKSNYIKLFKYQLIVLRYFLAFVLISYGMMKLFLNQFSYLSLFDLIKPYGDSSPMALLWNFMEYSPTYSIFSGLVELIAGLLLLFRNTTKLGALLGFGALLNVFILNMSFDVPVKLFSLHLVITAFLILLPFSSELLKFFILNKPIESNNIKPYFSNRKYNNMGFILKGILILSVIYQSYTDQIESQKDYGIQSPYPDLYGIYNVVEFQKNNERIVPLTTDTLRWKKLIIDKRKSGIVQMNDEVEFFRNETDTVRRTISLTSKENPSNLYYLNYKEENGQLFLYNDILDIKLIKIERKDFLLINRGFRWVSETSFNR